MLHKHRISNYTLFTFPQFLVSFLSQLSELLGLCKQFLGLFGEGLQQAVVTDLTHDELLELAPVGLFVVQVEAVLTSFVLGGVEFRCKPRSD